MKSSGLRERLLKELARNKAKSAALGVLCLVACYFWLPLVTKPFKQKTPAKPAAETPTTTAVVNPQPVSVTEEAIDFHWKEFLTWMADEPRMTVMAISTSTRDPFLAPEPAEAPAAASQTVEQGDEPDMEEPETVKSPADLGMVLHSTVVGGRASVANIGGTNFRLGNFVPIPGVESAPEPGNAADGFTLMEVKPRHVILERQGQLFQLDLQPSAAAEKNISIRALPK